MSPEVLIQAVRNQPCIYDKNHRDFRDSLVKNRAWKAVAVRVGEPVRQCQVRWKSLRDRYVRETFRKQGTSSASSGVWQHLAALEFLRENIAVKPSSSNGQPIDGVNNFLNDVLVTDSVSMLLPQSLPDVPSKIGKDEKAKMKEKPMSIEVETVASPTSEVEAFTVPSYEEFAAYLDDADYLSSTRNCSKAIGNSPLRSDSPPILPVNKTTNEPEPQPDTEQLNSNRNAAFLNMLGECLLKLNEDQQEILKQEVLEYVSAVQRTEEIAHAVEAPRSP